MVEITEKEQEASDDYLLHKCGNYILVSSVYCKFCKVFNSATTAKECPTCGQELLIKVEE